MSTELTLTRDESQALADCERIINRGLIGFAELGRALIKIRDLRLYRQDHDTFEDYCQARWNISRPRAYQLLAASGVVDALPENLSTIVDTESKARALASVPEAERPAVLEQVKASGKPVTAKAIKEAAKPKPAPVVVEVTPEPARPEERFSDDSPAPREACEIVAEMQPNEREQFAVHFLAEALARCLGNPQGCFGMSLTIALATWREQHGND